MTPEVSVIIPTFNRADFLPDAVNSALHQTLLPREVIVVDDVSTDETPSVMSQFCASDDRIKYIRLEENGGPTRARNLGAQKAIGALIAFLDSDDVWLPYHLETAINVFQTDSQTVAVLTQRGQIDASGQVTHDLVWEPASPDISNVLLKRIIFHPSRLVLSKSAWFKMIEDTPQIVPAPRFAEDYYHGVCLLHNYGNRVHLVRDRTVWMRAHGHQSFHSAQRLKGSLMKAVDQIFISFPDLAGRKSQVKAANLFHASYFLWLTGNWGEAWNTLWEGMRVYPQSVVLKDFWVALSRLVLPPAVRHWIRGEG